jgi:hypothetical protein
MRTNIEDKCCKEAACECRPNDPREGCWEESKIRETRITQLNYGYLVNVGCQTFAFETVDKLIEKLGEYLKNPSQTEKDWYSGKLL